MSKRRSSQKENDHDDNPSIEDEQARREIKILSARLYDLRERFMKVVQKINRDADGYANEISDEDDESDNEMSVDENDSDSIKTSNTNNDEINTQHFLIKCILENKARRYEYLKYIVKYPKIMNYLINDDSNSKHIPLRYLEPFIKEYVNKNPNGKIYDKITTQIEDIRQNYLKRCL